MWYYVIMKTDMLAKFGAALREWRESKEWSQLDLSNMLGVDRCEVSRYESGKRAPSSGVAVTIEELTGIRCTRKAVEFWYE